MTTLLCRRVAALAFTFGVLASGTVFAHHSFTAEFDSKGPVTLKGTITRMEWVNPHAWLYIDVKGADGKTVSWALEFGGANSLYKRGWRRDDLPAGTEVTVKGFRARNGKPIAAADDVTTSGGKKLFAGSSGTGAPGDSDDNK
jgi:hypothetical protein